MHKTETVDYAILLDGERTLVLDDGEVEWKPGDIVIDVGAWHQWSSRNAEGGRVAFDMIAARFVDGPVGLAQGNDKIMRGDPNQKLPPGVKPARRIVVTDREPNKSSARQRRTVSRREHRPGTARLRDPAHVGDRRDAVQDRAGIAASAIHDRAAAERLGAERGHVSARRELERQGRRTGGEGVFQRDGIAGRLDLFAGCAAPLYAEDTDARFRHRQEGEIVLVLDTQEVVLKKGDFVVQRGTNHAWSNRSGAPAVVAIASHDGKW